MEPSSVKPITTVASHGDIAVMNTGLTQPVSLDC